jgi:hypothetical protein
MPFVCLQPMLTWWSRRTEDLTFDKTDEKVAVLIARLTAQLRCYIPNPSMRPGVGCVTWVLSATLDGDDGVVVGRHREAGSC